MKDFPLPPVTDELRKLFRFGLSVPLISRRTGIPANQLEALVRRKLVEKPFRSKTHYYCDQDFFEVIDTEQKAYWFGFLCADGCIVGDRGVNLLLAGYERPHLEKYRAALEAEHPIEERWDTVRDKSRAARTQHCVKVRITSQKMVADLVAKGCEACKSMTLGFPSKRDLPAHLLRHFVRGYFDGDGSIWNIEGTRKWGSNVIGTKRFVMQMAVALAATGEFEHRDFSLEPHPNFAKNGMMYLQLCSFRALKRLRQFLYRDATVFLDRKRATFERLPEDTVSSREEAREFIQLHLSGTQEPADTHEMLALCREQHPDMQIQTFQSALRELREKGVLVALGRRGKRAPTIYAYNFPEEDHPLRERD